MSKIVNILKILILVWSIGWFCVALFILRIQEGITDPSVSILLIGVTIFTLIFAFGFSWVQDNERKKKWKDWYE